MRVPIRKPDKYTHLKIDPHMTQAKFNELEKSVEKLKKISRPRAAEEVKRLAMMGDFSENAAYQISKGRLRGINQRILDIEDLLKRAEIIEPQLNKDFVQLGHKVTVEISGKIKTYQILGSAESNPSAGIISLKSPIGSVLIGRRVGEAVKIEINKKLIEYKIIKIE